VKRGEIWTVAGGGDYTGKARPVVVLQDDRFDSTGSITFCAFTTNPTEAPLFRILVEPTGENGLAPGSRLMVDKITTIRRTRMGTRIGRLSDEDLIRVNRAILVFLGLAGTARTFDAEAD